MNFARLSYFEKVAVVAAVVVVVTALFSLANDWGILMAVSFLAGLGVLFVAFQPQMAPAMALPGSKGSLLVTLGALATIVTAVVGLTWIDWIGRHLGELDTLQFLVGLVAAAVTTWAGWQVLRAEGGRFQLGSRPTPPTAPPSA